MKIVIGHLFPYELTLYGENGNLKALVHELKKKNIEVEIKGINKEDKIDLKGLDMLYIGSGTINSIKEIKARLTPYKKEFLDFINKDKVLLATGNSIEILEFLGLYETKYYEKRRVADTEATTSLCNGKIFGFQNTEYLIKSTNSVLFNIDAGYGNNDTLMEGFEKNNFYATSIIGPILARNDNLNKFFIELLIKNKEI